LELLSPAQIADAELPLHAILSFGSQAHVQIKREVLRENGTATQSQVALEKQQKGIFFKKNK